MNNEPKFFTIDKNRAELLRHLSEMDNIPRNPEEILNELREVQEKLPIVEQIAIKKFKELKTHLEQFLQQFDKQGMKEIYDEGIECLNIVEEKSQAIDSKEVVLECIEKLSRILDSVVDLYCEKFRIKKEFEQICSIARDIKNSESYKYYVYYKYLKIRAKDLSILDDLVLKKGLKEEYGFLVGLAEIYRKIKRGGYYLLFDFVNIVNMRVRDDNNVFPLLSNLRDLTGTGEVDLVRAYEAYLPMAKLIQRPIMEKPIEIIENLSLVFALAYVLANIAERVNMNELAKELEVYVKSILAGSGRDEEKVKKLYLDLIKITSLPICLGNKADWQIAVALGLSAARYWNIGYRSKWNDKSSFIELCSGLKTLSQHASKEEIEQVLTYASLFGDFDFIIKLDPLLRRYRSLRSLSYIFEK